MKRLIIIFVLLCSCGFAQTISQRLNDIDNAKTAIKNAIESKDVAVDAAPFSNYADKIGEIRTVHDVQDIPAYLAENMSSGIAAYVTTDYIHNTIAFDSAPDTVNNVGVTGLAFSADGSRLVTKPRGTGSVLNSYNWNAASQRYEKTAAVLGTTAVQSYQVAMTRDGSRIAFAGAGDASSLRWSSANNRYEVDTAPDTSPATGYGAAISDDGNRLVLTDNNAAATAKILTFIWDSGDEQFKLTTAPDVQPAGQPYYCSMSADGEFLAVAHAGTSAPARLITYKWHTDNGRYEATANHSGTVNGLGVGVSLSSDGSKLAIGHTTNAPYIVSFSWVAGNNRYEPDAAISYGDFTPPANSCYAAELSCDGNVLVASFLTTATPDVPYFVAFAWNADNNRYEAISSRRYGTTNNQWASSAAISGNGLFAASAHAENAMPVYTYHIATAGINLAQKHINPLDDAATFSADINSFGFVMNQGLLGQQIDVGVLWWRPGAFPPPELFGFDPITQTITGYAGTDTDLTIPGTIDGVEVLHISDNALRDLGIVTLTLPEGLLTIGNYAFYDNAITDVILPSTITSVAGYAFNSNGTTRITIPTNVYVAGHAFDGLSFWNTYYNYASTGTQYRIGGTFEMIAGYWRRMEMDPEALKAYTLHNNMVLLFDRNENAYDSVTAIPRNNGETIITEIASYAFDGANMTHVGWNVPPTITKINNYAFQENSIEKVHINGNIVEIGVNAYTVSNSGDATGTTNLSFAWGADPLVLHSGIWQGNWLLTGEIDLSKRNITNIPLLLFGGCSGITSVKLHTNATVDLTGHGNIGTVTAIEGSAFLGTSIASVVLPTSVISVANSAFATNYYSGGITQVTLGSGVAIADASSFSDGTGTTASLKAFYEAGGLLAGTYVYDVDTNTWSKTH